MKVMNPIQITAEDIIYNDILIKICNRVYHYADKLPPIRELCEDYHFAATTVKKAMKHLRQDGFIKGETTNGTTVTFDCTNPEHIKRLRSYALQTKLNELNDLEIPSILIASMTAVGMSKSSDFLKRGYIKEIDRILLKIKKGGPYPEDGKFLLKKIINQTENLFMHYIFEDLSNQFLVMIPPNEELNLRYHEIGITYYSELKKQVIAGDYTKIKMLTQEYCKALHDIPDAISIALANKNPIHVHEETLYHQVLQGFTIEIFFGKIKKGEFFLTTPKLCEKYGVSRKTLNKVYKILESFKLIEVIPYQGARLMVDKNDPKIPTWMKEKMDQWFMEIQYALDVFQSIGNDVFFRLAACATHEMIEIMENNLKMQWENAKNHQGFLMVRDALLTPLLTLIESSMVHRHYRALMTPLIQFASFCSFRLEGSYHWQNNIYTAANQAISALKRGDVNRFMRELSIANLYNDNMFQRIRGE